MLCDRARIRHIESSTQHSLWASATVIGVMTCDSAAAADDEDDDEEDVADCANVQLRSSCATNQDSTSS